MAYRCRCRCAGRQALHAVFAIVGVFLSSSSQVHAAASDFEIFRCPVSNATQAKMAAEPLYEYHCLSTAKRFVKGSTAGMGYFEGHYDPDQSRALVKWFNVAMAAGNPDRLQVQAGAGVITYGSLGADKSVKWTQRWLGGDAPAGDRMEDAPLGTRTCVREQAADANLYHRVCLSAGDPDADLAELPHGLDGAVFSLGDGNGEMQTCHMGRSTISHFTAKLTSEECAGLQSAMSNYTHGAISCDGNEGVYEGYFQPASTLRFQGQGSVGLVGSWVATTGSLAGYQGSSVLVASRQEDGVVKGVGFSMVLDAVHGGILAVRPLEFTLALDSAGSALQRPCDAAKTRGFTAIKRFCEPDDAWGYVNPWAPDTTTPHTSTASSASTLSPDKVLKCISASPSMHGDGVKEEYHCVYKDANSSRRVSGSYGKYGYFQGKFDSAGEAHVNFFQVSKTSTGVVQAVSGAAVLEYNVGGDNMPVGLLASKYWYTGTSSIDGIGTWSVSGCEEVTDETLKARMCMGPAVEAVKEDWAGSCQDEPAFTDSLGRTCHEWSQHPSWCEGSPEDGTYDPPSVYANSDGVDPSQACCVCKQANLPFAGTKWIRKGPDELHYEGTDMGEVAFCSQAVNPVVPHSFRELKPSCTKRMVDEDKCFLTEFDNRTVRSDSLIFAGSVPGALGFVGVYDGAEESGHMLLVLTATRTLRGFSCTHGGDGNVTRCKYLNFALFQQDLACESSVKSTCKLIKDDASVMQWSDLRPMRASNSFYTGGLGDLARTGRTYKYGVWSCVRDWNATQQLYCGSGPGRLVCFKYEDISQTFEFWGLNSDLRLVAKSEAEHTTFV